MRQLKISKSVTSREHRSFEIYLQDIGKVEMISAEEEIILAQKIREGDQKALEKLTKANLRFVVSVAKQYQNQGLSLPDLVNEGNIGLMKAAKRFDESRGFKFISYAVRRIRQSILQALAEQSRTVRLPLNQIGKLNKITRESMRLEQELGRSPTTEEIAEALDMDKEDIESSLANVMKLSSFDTPLTHDDNDTTFLDVLENHNIKKTDHDLEIESVKEDINRMISTMLTEREKIVLEHYFGLNGKQAISMDEIGDIFDLTRERIRQMKEKAIKRLKRSTKSKLLKKYLE